MNKLFVCVALCAINSIYAMQPEQIKSELLGQRTAVVLLLTRVYAELDLAMYERFLEHRDFEDYQRMCTLLAGVICEKTARLNLLCEKLEHARPAQFSQEPIGLRVAMNELSLWRDAMRKQFEISDMRGTDIIEIPPVRIGAWELLPAYTAHLGEPLGMSLTSEALENHYRVAERRAQDLGCVEGELYWGTASGRLVKWISLNRDK